MNEFLNPKSMVTPGVAGALVMLIANALVSQFPEAPFRWVIISLSFIVGAVVFSAVDMPMVQRVAFWAINSLIIFSVGIGTSNVAAYVQKPALSASSDMPGAFLDFLVSPAHAHNVGFAPPEADLCPEEREKLRAELQRTQSQLANMTRQLERTQRSAGFFKRW